MTKLQASPGSSDSKHERRVVGHVSGWQEQMDTCICGKPWPCADAMSDPIDKQKCGTTNEQNEWNGQVVAELRELMLFLCGEGPMVGLWFGDRNPAIRGAFWWRNRFVRPRIERAIAAIERSPADVSSALVCGTCSGSRMVFESTVVPEDTPTPCPSCAPRADGSAAEVKRYVLGWQQGNGPFDKPEPAMIAGNWSPDKPSYVLASAYEAVVAERDALRVREAALVADRNEMLSRARAAEEQNSALASRVAELEARNASLERDAARYRWLREKQCGLERGMSAPKFVHDCEACKFLGHHNDHDMYYCEGVSATVVARYGDDGHEYTSGLELAKHDPNLATAKRLATEAGLIK